MAPLHVNPTSAAAAQHYSLALSVPTLSCADPTRQAHLTYGSGWCSVTALQLEQMMLICAACPRSSCPVHSHPPGAPDLREWVVQRYIGNPLLVGGRKFHLRAYVLCVGESPACP